MFQSTPPRGRRRWEIRGGVGIAGFNPRLRVGGDLSGETHGPRTAGFNPRLRVGGDLTSVPGLTPEQQFQSTPPRGRRHDQGDLGHPGGRFQSTPPRGRRLFMPMSFTPPSQVSIHASAWEATDACWWNPPRWPVSIHASAWEATGLVSVFDKISNVSIHASAWEATGACL